MIPLLLALSAFATAALVVFLACTASRPQARDEEGTEPVATRSVAGRSFFDRVVKQAALRAVAAGRRFTPVGYLERCTQKLQYAGRRGPEEVDKFLAMRTLTIVVALVFAVLAVLSQQGLTLLPHVGARTTAMTFGLLALLALLGPDAALNRAADARRFQVRCTLPDVLDLLTISVEAGLGFEQSIQYVTDSMEGPLPEEFSRMNAEMRAGQSRADALRALSARLDVEDVRLFVMAILQADKFGVSISRVLREQAEEMRIKRHQLAQESAQKAPVKMLLPMTFFIFPPLFIVVLGPALMSIAAGLKA